MSRGASVWSKTGSSAVISPLMRVVCWPKSSPTEMVTGVPRLKMVLSTSSRSGSLNSSENMAGRCVCWSTTALMSRARILTGSSTPSVLMWMSLVNSLGCGIDFLILVRNDQLLTAAQRQWVIDVVVVGNQAPFLAVAILFVGNEVQAVAGNDGANALEWPAARGRVLSRVVAGVAALLEIDVHFGPHRNAILVEEGEVLRHFGDDSDEVEAAPLEGYFRRVGCVIAFRLHEGPEPVHRLQ